MKVMERGGSGQETLESLRRMAALRSLVSTGRGSKWNIGPTFVSSCNEKLVNIIQWQQNRNDSYKTLCVTSLTVIFRPQEGPCQVAVWRVCFSWKGGGRAESVSLSGEHLCVWRPQQEQYCGHHESCAEEPGRHWTLLGQAGSAAREAVFG